MTYRFYFLLNLTIFFFTYFFLECYIRLDLSTLVPLNLVRKMEPFFIFLLNLHFLKGVCFPFWTWLLNASFAFSSFKDFFQKILKVFWGCFYSFIFLDQCNPKYFQYLLKKVFKGRKKQNLHLKVKFNSLLFLLKSEDSEKDKERWNQN